MSHREPKKEAKQKNKQDKRPHIMHNEEVNKAVPQKIDKGLE